MTSRKIQSLEDLDKLEKLDFAYWWVYVGMAIAKDGRVIRKTQRQIARLSEMQADEAKAVSRKMAQKAAEAAGTVRPRMAPACTVPSLFLSEPESAAAKRVAAHAGKTFEAWAHDALVAATQAGEKAGLGGAAALLVKHLTEHQIIDLLRTKGLGQATFENL